MTLIPIALYWGLALWGVFSSRPVLVYLLVMSMPFMSWAIVPVELTGGLTFLPATMTAVLICIRQLFVVRDGYKFILSCIARQDWGVTIFTFWIWAMILTVFAPRMFANKIEIVPVRVTGFMETGWLTPTTQNASQMLYLSISVALVFSMVHNLRSEHGFQRISDALVKGGWVAVFSGTLDFLSQFVPISPLLDVFRTSSYVMHAEASFGESSKRIVGLTPEASSYANLCIGFLALLWFSRNGFPDRIRRQVIILCLFLFCMILLSTSSAGLASLGVFSAMAFLEIVLQGTGRARLRKARRKFASEFIGAGFLVSIAVWLIFVIPSARGAVSGFIETLLFNKLESTSYMERSLWTRVSMDAAYSSYLLGVGVGSTRASNGVVAVFAATGIVGMLLYYGFVLQALWRHTSLFRSELEAVMSHAVRWSFLPLLSFNFLTGTTAVFSLMVALHWAIVLAASRNYRRKSRYVVRENGATVGTLEADLITNR